MPSRVRLFATPWTVALQATLTTGFPGKNTGVGCHFFLQWIFPAQRWNLHLWCFLRWQVYFLPLCHLGSPASSAVYEAIYIDTFWINELLVLLNE